MSIFTEPELANLRRTKVVVLWDLVECPIPEGMDVATAAGNIRLALKNAGYQGNTDMSVFGDAMKMRLGQFLNASVDFNDLPKEYEDETRRQMILSHFLCKAIDYRIQVSLMLICGDISGHVQFSNAFDLLQRKRYNIILAQPKEDSPMLKDIYVSTTWLWSTLSVGGQALKTLKFADDDMATDSRVPQSMSTVFGNYDSYWAKTIIFWDISGCKPPHGLEVLDVVALMAEALDDKGCGNLTRNSIRLYCDVFEMAEVLCHTNFGMLHGSNEEDRRKKIFVDFMCMAVRNVDSLNLVLIMEDISGRDEFLHAFSYFQWRKNVKIFVSQPHRGEVSDELLSSVEAVWVWSSLSISGCPIGDEEEEGELSDKKALISGKADVISDTELSFEYSSTDSEYGEQFISREPENSVSVQEKDKRLDHEEKAKSEWKTKTITKPGFKRKTKTADSTKDKIETSNRFSTLEISGD
ncbi:hypothetical protein HA466_0097750 [Hirschfeldia incana]|nr:hypothetical protein HA466_0097750 [Hirschfeldia incana]